MGFLLTLLLRSLVKESALEQTDTQLNKEELVEPVSQRATKLRGRVRPSRGLDLCKRPSELPALDDALGLADGDENGLYYEVIWQFWACIEV